MKHEELVQQIAAILRRQFRTTAEQELRVLTAAEKIVKSVIHPEVKEREKALHYLYKSRTSSFDS